MEVSAGSCAGLVAGLLGWLFGRRPATLRQRRGQPWMHVKACLTHFAAWPPTPEPAGMLSAGQSSPAATAASLPTIWTAWQLPPLSSVPSVTYSGRAKRLPPPQQQPCQTARRQ